MYSIVQTIMENKQENLRLLQDKLQRFTWTTTIVYRNVRPGLGMNSRKWQNHSQRNHTNTQKVGPENFSSLLPGFICMNKVRIITALSSSPRRRKYYYDKRHLFAWGEAEHFPRGSKYLHREWNICLLVCPSRFRYRRNVNNEYDLIYVASWPQARRLVWDTLLRARAFREYVLCMRTGVATGTDGNNHLYNGGSIVCSAKGEILTSVPDGKESYRHRFTQLVSNNSVIKFRYGKTQTLSDLSFMHFSDVT